EAGGGPERLAQPAGGVGDGLVAQRCHRLGVSEQGIDIRCGLHDDIIMTSSMLPVKSQCTGRSFAYACRGTFLVPSTVFTYESTWDAAIPLPWASHRSTVDSPAL